MKKQDDLQELLEEDIEDKSMRIWINVFLFIGVFGLAISIFLFIIMILNSNQVKASDIAVTIAMIISSLFLCFMGCCTLWMENLASNIRQTNLILKYQNGIIRINAPTENKSMDEDN